MKNLFIGVLIGVVIALGIFHVCDRNGGSSATGGDSLFLNAVYARPDTEQVRENTRRLHQLRENAITRAVAKVSPAVVGINVLQVRRIVQKSPFNIDDPLWRAIFPELFRDRVYEQRIKSLGSGFLVSPDGYLITNEHVVENAAEIVVTMTNGKHYEAELVGSDWVTDIALLKIEGENFPYIEMGDSDDLIVGEWVIALGNPFGLFELNDKPTVTVGVISAVDRDWGRTETGRLYLDMIQTDAAINHGNSGGPLVNSLGQVIGMNTFIYTGSRYQEGFVGIGFAIPINRIKEVVREIKEKGGINRNYWLGILKVQDLNPFIISALGLNVDYGAIIAQIEPRSPAAKAGLKEEDVIIALNGQRIENAQHLVDVLENMDLKVGDVLTFTVVRGKTKMDIQVTLKPLPR
ncbi:MAG: trypsin-like serine protease [Calditrichaeota bacterium]|nr:trypsin-like serine protease [Calditrichota bacterium]